jgi:hypothetical protein
MRQQRPVGWLLAIILGLATATLAYSDEKSSPEPKKPDVTKLQQQFKEAMARIKALLKEIDALRDTAVAAEIRAKAHKDKVEGLERQVKKLALELARLKAGKAEKPAANNAPPEDVKGLVTEVKDGKIRISIGSDAGLAKGHTLEVFRLKPAVKYLGRLRIVEVKAKEAVGVAAGKKFDVEKGDEVASRIQPR